MPTYSYRCTACEHAFDIQQSFQDSSLTECPQCAGQLRKVFSAVGVVFKGSGFYRTDARASNGRSKTSSTTTTKTAETTSNADSSTSASTASTSTTSTASTAKTQTKAAAPATS